MTPDSELLRAYVETGSEAAFAEVVRRHVNLVYAAAARFLNDDATLAEDVTQAVFTSLARKAARLSRRQSVAGWLYTSARFAASSAVRAEQRRRTREHEAHAMSDHSSNHEEVWAQLRPLLDEALRQLKETEREAVLLRFFEERSHREVGVALGLTENAAQMRVNRAMDKMRAYFTRHGVTTTVALLATTLGAQAAGPPAPASFAACLTGKSLAGAASAGSAPGTWLHNITRAKKSALLAGTVAVAATSVLAGKYFSWPQPPSATIHPALVASLPAPAKTISTPAPTMNPPNILHAAVLSAALLSTSATTATATTVQTAVASPQSTVSASGQIAADPSSSDATTSTSQSLATTQDAPSSTDTQEDVVPAPPGMGIAIWDPQFRPVSQNRIGRWKENVVAEHPPHLVDMTGVLKGKIVTAIDGWGDMNPVLGDMNPDGRLMALCSDGTVAVWGPGYPPSHISQDANGTSNYVPTLVDTSAIKDKKIATIEVRADGNFILCTDGSIYGFGFYNWDGNFFSGKPGVKKLDMGGRITKFSGNDDYFIAIRYNGTVIANGIDEAGRLGIGPEIDSTIDGQRVSLTSVYTGGVLQGKKVIDIATYGSQSLALCSDGTLVQWGDRVVPGMYELGLQADSVNLSRSNREGYANKFNGYFTSSDIPVRVVDETGVLKGKTITAIAHVASCILVLCSDGIVAAWGGEVSPPSAEFKTNINMLGDEIYDDNLVSSGGGGLGHPFPDLPATSYPILVSGTGALAGKTVTAITDGGLMLCSDNTLVQWNGDSAPVAVNLGPIKGRTIVSIAPGAVVFK